MSDDLEEYGDPLNYDCEYGSFEPDGLFYLSLANQINGPILDLGCGTGRLTIPFAKKGLSIVGFDNSPIMLKRAKEKSPDVNVEWIQGDFLSFRIANKFNFIFIAGNAFQAVLTNDDQNIFLSNVKDHLASTGLFVFCTRNPNLTELARENQEEYWHTYRDEIGREVKAFGYHSYDRLTQIATYITHRYQELLIKKSTTKISLRYTFPQEMEALLKHNGFKVIHKYGGYCGEIFDGKQEQIIYICSLVENFQ